MTKLDWEKANRLDKVAKRRALPPAIEGPIAQRCESCGKYAIDVKKYLRTSKPKKRGKKHRLRSKHSAVRVSLCPDCAERRRTRGLIR